MYQVQLAHFLDPHIEVCDVLCWWCFSWTYWFFDEGLNTSSRESYRIVPSSVHLLYLPEVLQFAIPRAVLPWLAFGELFTLCRIASVQIAEAVDHALRTDSIGTPYCETLSVIQQVHALCGGRRFLCSVQPASGPATCIQLPAFHPVYVESVSILCSRTLCWMLHMCIIRK